MKPYTAAEFIKKYCGKSVSDLSDEREEREAARSSRQVDKEHIMSELDIASPEAAETLYGWLLQEIPDEDDIRAAGFQGFVSFSELCAGKIASVPSEAGVYMVLLPDSFRPGFIQAGTGGHFKGRNPNVDIDTLENAWVEDTCVVYIGKAGGGSSSSTLQKRLRQYIRFGSGEPVGHWGGRYVWQLKDYARLLFCWRPSLPGEDAARTESELIEGFKARYGGRRPFANLRD